MSEPRKDEQEQKPPGYGVDRTLIHRMLAMTPQERLEALVEESNNLSMFFGSMRRK
jgi:hypothetical protein